MKYMYKHSTIDLKKLKRGENLKLKQNDIV